MVVSASGTGLENRICPRGETLLLVDTILNGTAPLNDLVHQAYLVTSNTSTRILPSRWSIGTHGSELITAFDFFMVHPR